MEQSQHPEVKIAIVGETAVGKTSIALKFTSNSFSETQASTNGASFLRKSLTVDGQFLKFQIWDTAGQEKFRSLTPMYYRAAGAVLCVFDLTNAASFKQLEEFWVQEVRTRAPAGCVVMVVGNKADREDRAVTADVVQKFCRDRALRYFECSAQTGAGVLEIFQAIARMQLEVFIERKEADLNDGKIEKGKGCC